VKSRLSVIDAYKSAQPSAAQQSAGIRPQSTIGGGGSKMIPLWNYDVESTRDGGFYTGVMVGTDPAIGGTSKIPTYIVPLVITTHTIVTGAGGDGTLQEKSNVPTTFDPTQPDACLPQKTSPASLVVQSPVFSNATFDFGGTIFGPTQYVDAFQRSNFWTIIAKNNYNYHVLLNPVKTLSPVFISVPPDFGTALPPDFTGSCNYLGLVDINWLDSYLDSVVLPALVAKGVNPGALPVFISHNLAESIGNPSNGPCCILGYHSEYNLPIQTYVVADFDTTQLFSSPFQDSSTLSHEIAEWMDDPFGNNATPAWGYVGQQSACQNNLEVGDPLSGSDPYRIYSSSTGFTFHLQELAYFSWFFGGESTAINNWYSNDATFLTDAGPVCESTPAAAASNNTLWHFHTRTASSN
jgi:hypothetical protein